MTLADRLRAISKTDSTVNALIHLDVFTKTVPQQVEESLAELEYLFDPFIQKAEISSKDWLDELMGKLD